MTTPICPTSGFTARAARFANEGEIFVGMAVGEAWDNDAAPPEPSLSDRGLGRIKTTGYSCGTVTIVGAGADTNTITVTIGGTAVVTTLDAITSVSVTTMAAAVAAAINGNPTAAAKVTATSALGVVTLVSITGTTHALTVADTIAGTVTATTSSVTAADTSVRFNKECFQAGVESYKVVALTATTYQVRKVSDNSVVTGVDLATSWSSRAAGRDDIIKGLTFYVTGTAMVAGDYRTFKIDGPIAFKKASVVELVVADDDGTIEYYDGNYRILTEAEAFELGARHVYVEAEFRYDEHPLVDYRQVGVLTGLVRASGVSGALNELLPSEVDEAGYVNEIHNQLPYTRQLEDRQFHAFILEF